MLISTQLGRIYRCRTDATETRTGDGAYPEQTMYLAAFTIGIIAAAIVVLSMLAACMIRARRARG